MIENHVPIKIEKFNGLFDRGPDESVPLDHFKTALNIAYDNGRVQSRSGSDLSLAIANVVRFHVYKIEGTAPRLLILDSTGTLFDSLRPTVPILSIPAMTDFSIETFYDRAYITPHNGITGLPGQNVYVYTGSDVARIAGSSAPFGFALGVATSAVSGHVEKGMHLFAVAYETVSGYVSGAGPEIFPQYDAPGAFKVDISNINVGPPGTVARHILATQIITDYNGDQNAYEFFFVPDGRLVTGTTITVDFFDADLLRSADYLFEQLPVIPAGVGIGSYQGSMVVWGEDSNPSIVRVSKPGEPESFNAIEGYFLCDPSDGGGVKNCVEFRQQLIAFKAQRSFVTQSASDFGAIYWNVMSLDRSVGTEPFGIGKILETVGNTVDKFIIADRRGLLLYNGTFDMDLTFKIADVWGRINKKFFYKIQVLIDPVQEKIYVAAPLDAATNNSHILYGDYSNGLDPTVIKWSIWTFPAAPNSIALDVDDLTEEAHLKYSHATGNIYVVGKPETNDYNNAFTQVWETGQLPPDTVGEVFHYGGARLRVSGTGGLTLVLTTLDGVRVLTNSAINLSQAPGVYPIRFFNAQSEQASLKGTLTAINQTFRMTRLYVFVRELWMTRPNQ